MDRRQLLTVLAATTTGCLRFIGSGGNTPTTDADPHQQPPSATPTPTQTPAPTTPSMGTSTPTPQPATPTQTPTQSATPAPYPTGMTADGVSGLLADQHTNSLIGQSFTTHVVDRNLTHSHQATFNTQAADGQFLISITEPNGQADVYVPARRQLWRTEFNGAWVYGLLEDGWELQRATGSERMRPYFDAGEFGTPQKHTTNGETRYRIETTGIADPHPLRRRFDAETLQDLTVRADVTASGIVRSFTAEPLYVRGDEQILQRITVETADVGATSVAEPEWASTARARDRTFGVSLRDDQRGVTYTHQGGAPAPAGSRVGLDADPELVSGEEVSYLAEPLESGQSFVVYVDGQTVAHSRAGIPSDADTTELPLEGWTWFGIGLKDYFHSDLVNLG